MMNKKMAPPCVRDITCIFLYVIILTLPNLVIADCTCEKDEEMGDKGLAMKYKIIALVSILAASALGVTTPMLGKTFPALSPEKDLFFMIKAFAAGVILSTGFIHVLPDAFEKLTSPCLSDHPWPDFPFTGFVAMLAAIGTLMVDSLATVYFKNSNLSEEDRVVVDTEKDVNIHVHTRATHGHAHGAIRSPSMDHLRHRVISQVLELGIVVHSVIIGISLGASESPKTIQPLIAALTFHQLFKGMGLDGCISQIRAVVVMGLLTPVEIVIGMIISRAYKENSQYFLIVEGVLNTVSAGILIYMSLVDLLAADLMNPKRPSKQ